MWSRRVSEEKQRRSSLRCYLGPGMVHVHLPPRARLRSSWAIGSQVQLKFISISSRCMRAAELTRFGCSLRQLLFIACRCFLGSALILDTAQGGRHLVMFLFAFCRVNVGDRFGEMARKCLSQKCSIVQRVGVDYVVVIAIMLDEWFLYLRQSTFLCPPFPPGRSAFSPNAVMLDIDETYKSLESC